MFNTIYNSGSSLFPDMPELARKWLEELNKLGLSEKEQIGSAGKIAYQISMDDLADTVPLGDTRYVWLRNGQMLRLYLNAAIRSRRGSRSVEVLPNTRRTDMAIIAALTVLEGRALKPEKVRRWWLRKTLGDEEPVFNTLENFQFRRLWLWAGYLLAYYRSDSGDRSYEENVRLVQKTCTYIYDFLESLRRLLEFLEYGEPDQDTRPVVEAAERDMQAAVLKYVDGLKHREIAEELNIPLSESARTTGDLSTVREIIRRGRRILEQAWGEEGWEQAVESLRADAQHWRGLTNEEQEAEFKAQTSWINKDMERMLRFMRG